MGNLLQISITYALSFCILASCKNGAENPAGRVSEESEIEVTIEYPFHDPERDAWRRRRIQKLMKDVEEGSAEAAFELNSLFTYAERDYGMAYYWIVKAKEMGHPLATDEMIENAVGNIEAQYYEMDGNEVLSDGLPEIVDFELLVTESKRMISKASYIDMWFHTGFSGEASKKSVAMLCLLESPAAMEIFEAFTDIPGVPSMYGLIGLQIADETQARFLTCYDKVLRRDENLEVRTSYGDNVGSEKLGALIALSQDAEVKDKLKYGEYASSLLSKYPNANLDYVVENGLSSQKILNPYFGDVFYYSKMSDADRKEMNRWDRLKIMNGKTIIEGKMLHDDPRGVISLYGFQTDEEILEYLRRVD